MKISDYFYTVNQATKVLNINRITIWRWSKKNKLDIERVGREVLIPKWQIELIKQSRDPKVTNN